MWWGGISGSHQDETRRVYQVQTDLSRRRESSALLRHASENGPQATELSLSQIFPRPWQAGATRSQEGRALGAWRMGLADLP